MSTIPGSSSGKMPTWAIVLLSCCGGCALVGVLGMVLAGATIKALLAPKVPPPAAYVGVWHGSDNSTLAIGSDGVASFQSGGSSVTGGRVNVSGRKLSIKLAGLGQDWRIDSPPNGTSMKLNGTQYKRTASVSNGLLVNGSSTSISN